MKKAPRIGWQAARGLERIHHMDFTQEPDTRQEQRISLIQSLRGEWLKLPLAVMQEAGPAVQTFAGILKLTNKETFVDTTTIAAKARLPVATVRKHLVTLDGYGWIKNKGRQQTRTGRPRRTCTIALTAQARDRIEPYGVLPWWACGYVIKQRLKLSWGAKAVFSLVMARLMSSVAAMERHDWDTSAEEDSTTWDAIDNMWGLSQRFTMSLSWIQEQTGLTRETIAHAKRELNGANLLCWSAGGLDANGCSIADCVCPSPSAEIVVTPGKTPTTVLLHVEQFANG